MTVTLQGAIDEIMADLKVALPTVRNAPDDPQEQVAAFPFMTVHAGTGAWEEGPAGLKKGLHTIIVELHVARAQGLARAVSEALGFAEGVPNAVFGGRDADRFNGTIDTFDRITYTFGPISWAGVDTFGWVFRIEGVKQQTTIT